MPRLTAATAESSFSVTRVWAKARSSARRSASPSAGSKACASAFGIYRQLWEHRHQPVVLDDVDSLYADRDGVRLLKCPAKPIRPKRSPGIPKLALSSATPSHVSSAPAVASPSLATAGGPATLMSPPSRIAAISSSFSLRLSKSIRRPRGGFGTRKYSTSSPNVCICLANLPCAIMSLPGSSTAPESTGAAWSSAAASRESRSSSPRAVGRRDRRVCAETTSLT